MSDRIPTPVSGVDMFALPLSALEGFILSRVDGLVTVEDIAIMTRVSEEQLLPMLERLADLGAVKLGWLPDKASAHPLAGEAAKEIPAAIAMYDHPSRPPKFEPQELQHDVDIDRKVRRRILNAFYLLPSRNYYELLGVPEDADKAEIRDAYFVLSKVFHPDVFFGKELGPYRAKTETVFQRLTEAYEVLGRKKRRAEYDDFLETQFPRRRRKLKPAAPDKPETPASSPAASATPQPPRPPVKVRPRKSLEERRADVAERLRARMDSMLPPSGRTRLPEVVTPAPAPPETRERAKEHALEGLRHALRTSMTSQPGRTEQLMDKALASEAAGDLATALEILQLILKQEPEHADAHEAERRVRHAADSQSAADHLEKARGYERDGKWRAAARSWSIVADKEPGNELAHRHAGLALLRCNGDLHRARRYVEAAARIQPDNVANIVALARVYLAAGLKLNARRELEKAVKLNPHDETIKALLNDAR